MMNRTYTRKAFIDLAGRIRNRIPGVVLTTDVIAGFPTETEAEFNDTLNLMEEIRFDSAFIFIYSERKQTIAERKFPDDVPEAVKSDRVTRLATMQRQISYEKNCLEVGSVFEVLIEGKGKKPNQLIGRNDGNKIIAFPGNGYRVGDFVKVEVEEATPNTLIGRIKGRE